MSETLTKQFIEALGILESSGDTSQLENVFSENCELGNVIVPEKFHGRAGVKEFWTKYRGTFDQIRSTFRNLIVTDDRAALEWTTEGVAGEGQTIQYEGVSILEFEGGKVNRFRAYFDPAALGRQVQGASA